MRTPRETHSTALRANVGLNMKLLGSAAFGMGRKVSQSSSGENLC